MAVEHNDVGMIPPLKNCDGAARGLWARLNSVIRWWKDGDDDEMDEPVASEELIESPLLQREIFSNLMDMAKQIIERNPTGLSRLVTAILRPLQAEQILSVAERGQHSALDAVRFDLLFSPDYFFSFFDEVDCIKHSPIEHRVDLTTDIVLTTPWVRAGFASALAHIGEGRKCGAWRADPNHSIVLILPWRICIVNNGNHSIAAGILGQEGNVTPSNVLDFTPLFARVECDGLHFLSRDSGEVLARARSGRMAALFEVGRLLAAHM